MHEASFYHVAPDGVLQCDLCHHFCRIRNGSSGLCKMRTNTGGKLLINSFGKHVTTSADPIEKNHVYHFRPGSTTWSLHAPGANFRSIHAENSKTCTTPAGFEPDTFTSPETISAGALRAGCRSVSFSTIEPGMYAEYAIEVMKITRKHGLENIWKSNGYVSRNCLDIILPLLDVITIELMSIDDAFYRRVCGARIAPVLDTLQHLCQSALHLEVSTMLISGQTDDPAMLQRLARFIARNIGQEIPWHITPFRPALFGQTQYIPTTLLETIEKARALGRHEGLLHIYTNPSGIDTHCPCCGMKLVTRTPASDHWQISRFDLTGHCPACNAPSPIRNLNITQPLT
jgi:pyruvate formate lyase activating enzyme